MPKKPYTTEQIIRLLREAEVELAKGQTTGEVCRKSTITEQTYYRWRKEYGSLRVDQIGCLKELGQEEDRLWLDDGSSLRLRPSWPDHVWVYDFVADRTRDGVVPQKVIFAPTWI